MTKKILIVGANGGLAKETIKSLIENGHKNITMACRTESKGLQAKHDILKSKQHISKIELDVIGGFDMNEPEKIEKSIQTLNPSQPFDIVFLAAGNPVFEDDFQTVNYKDYNIEKNVFQNIFGSHFTLSKLKKYGLLKEKVRIVMSGGEGARGLKGMIGKPQFSSPVELRKYVFAQSASIQYNPMNALGVSKYFGALWTRKIANLGISNMSAVWFSPGLTYGTEGLKGLPTVKKWFMEKVMFGFMQLMGQAQSPADGGKKFADCILGKIGNNGDLLGAPEGKAIGRITDQTPMNADFTDQELIDGFWSIVEEVFGGFGD